MSIQEVKLTDNLHAIIKQQKGSIEAVRDVLIIELLEGSWKEADLSYQSLKILLEKERLQDEFKG